MNRNKKENNKTEEKTKDKTEEKTKDKTEQTDKGEKKIKLISFESLDLDTADDYYSYDF